MRFDTDEKALSLQIFDDGFTSFITIHAAVFFGHVIVKMCRFGHDVDLLQVMALTDFKVIEVVSRRNLHAAGTELFIHIIVSDDGDFSVCQRKPSFSFPIHSLRQKDKHEILYSSKWHSVNAL